VDARVLVQARARIILFDDESEDGMTVWDRRRGKCYVYINRRRLNGRRANFTWAHEAGHIYLEHGRLYDCNNLTEYERRILDREADLFAVELLMPRAWMEKFVAVPCGSAGLEQAGKLFGVSEPALVRRLAELGLQGYDETEAIRREEAAERLKSQKTVLYSHPARVLEWALQPSR
jgi:Zn-dependent peptidase ImmA (M78 family)